MDDAQPNHAKTVVYSAPPPETFDRLARQVCSHLGSDYNTTEMVEGLATFLRVTAAIQTTHLNRGAHVDKAE